ncbi:hypothetical protein [Cupriavidus campinensis]
MMPRTAHTGKAAAMTLPKGAKRAALPQALSPQLATLVDKPPADNGQWQYEVKFK